MGEHYGVMYIDGAGNFAKKVSAVKDPVELFTATVKNPVGGKHPFKLAECLVTKKDASTLKRVFFEPLIKFSKTVFKRKFQPRVIMMDEPFSEMIGVVEAFNEGETLS